MPNSPRQMSWPVQLLTMVAVITAVIVLGQFFVAWGAPYESVVCLYLLGVVLVSVLTTGYVFSTVCAIVCSLAYSYFIKHPVYAFGDLSFYTLLTVGLMMTISIIISSITSKVKEGQLQARRREEESAVLYQLTRDLAGCTSVDNAINIALRNIDHVFHTDCQLLLFTSEGQPEKTYAAFENGHLYPRKPIDPNRDFKEYAQRPQDGFFITHEQYEWPFYAPDYRVLGSISIPVSTARRLTPIEMRIVRTMSETIGIVIDKIAMNNQQQEFEMEVSQERYRTNLLRSISHDLRTPLAGIFGTADVLLSILPEKSEQWQLAANIRKESNWLYNMVQNILSLTRLQNGTVKLKKEVMVLEDVVNDAVETMTMRYPNKPIITSFPDEVLAAPMDASLMLQAIINLIENANKYSQPEDAIEIEVDRPEEKGMVAIHVKDNGHGLTPSSLDKIFTMFYTTRSNIQGAPRGFGLGLPICDSIMKAHDGRIEARNRVDGKKGAEFILYLPEYSL